MLNATAFLFTGPSMGFIGAWVPAILGATALILNLMLLYYLPGDTVS